MAATYHLPILGTELADFTQEETVSRGVKVESYHTLRGAVCLPLSLPRTLLTS